MGRRHFEEAPRPHGRNAARRFGAASTAGRVHRYPRVSARREPRPGRIAAAARRQGRVGGDHVHEPVTLPGEIPVTRIRSRSSAAAGVVLLFLALVPHRVDVSGWQRQQARSTPAVEWKTYGADLASTRFSPLDQINKDNFSKLKIAWQLKTNDFGPRPDTLYSATPLFVGNVLYTTAGSARTVVALNPTTGVV